MIDLSWVKNELDANPKIEDIDEDYTPQGVPPQMDHPPKTQKGQEPDEDLFEPYHNPVINPGMKDPNNKTDEQMTHEPHYDNMFKVQSLMKESLATDFKTNRTNAEQRDTMIMSPTQMTYRELPPNPYNDQS
jgi:hypothetical protein